MSDIEKEAAGAEQSPSQPQNAVSPSADKAHSASEDAAAPARNAERRITLAERLIEEGDHFAARKLLVAVWNDTEADYEAKKTAKALLDSLKPPKALVAVGIAVFVLFLVFFYFGVLARRI